jgi:flagellar basal-body rod protein FlgB
MDLNLDILRQSQTAASFATKRQTLVAANIANADTPGYKARDIRPFAQIYKADDGLLPRQTRPGHMMLTTPDTAAVEVVLSGADPSPNGNTVSLEREMVRAAELRIEYDMALGVFRKSIDILRASLGR